MACLTCVDDPWCRFETELTVDVEDIVFIFTDERTGERHAFKLIDEIRQSLTAHATEGRMIMGEWRQDAFKRQAALLDVAAAQIRASLIGCLTYDEDDDPPRGVI